MKPYQSEFIDRVKQAVKSGENSMLVYRKQGYESKAFRLQLKQLAQSFDGVLLEDRHAFTYVLHEYSRIGLYRYKETHEQTDKFNKIAEALAQRYQVGPENFPELCRKDPPGLKYLLLMCCYFLKVSEAHVTSKLGHIFFPDSLYPERDYQVILDTFRHDYNSGKQPSDEIDQIVNSIKAETHPFTVYCWAKERYATDRSIF
ncbi:MAG TPA: hypothetical protein VLC28_10050 [Flavitalea sp.]|nr:hypothetical protein [Flavitalea sp.]